MVAVSQNCPHLMFLSDVGLLLATSFPLPPLVATWAPYWAPEQMQNPALCHRLPFPRVLVVGKYKLMGFYLERV